MLSFPFPFLTMHRPQISMTCKTRCAVPASLMDFPAKSSTLEKPWARQKPLSFRTAPFYQRSRLYLGPSLFSMKRANLLQRKSAKVHPGQCLRRQCMWRGQLSASSNPILEPSYTAALRQCSTLHPKDLSLRATGSLDQASQTTHLFANKLLKSLFLRDRKNSKGEITLFWRDTMGGSSKK